MPQPTAPAVSPPKQWHNHLPAWILRDPGYAALPPLVERTLQKMADAADQADERGNLLNIYGGTALARRVRLARRTLIRHINQLERAGFVVVTEAGGQPGEPRKSHTYAIPGLRGGLGHLREARPRVAMTRVAGETNRLGQPKFVQRRVREHSQLTFWDERSGLVGNPVDKPRNARPDGAPTIPPSPSPFTSALSIPDGAASSAGGASPRKGWGLRYAGADAVARPHRLGFHHAARPAGGPAPPRRRASARLPPAVSGAGTGD